MSESPLCGILDQRTQRRSCPYALNYSRGQVFDPRLGHWVHVTQTEYIVLAVLSEYYPNPVSYRKLHQALWGQEKPGALDQILNRITAKLGKVIYREIGACGLGGI